MNPSFELLRAWENLGSREDFISLLNPRMSDAAQATPNIPGRL